MLRGGRGGRHLGCSACGLEVAPGRQYAATAARTHKPGRRALRPPPQRTSAVRAPGRAELEAGAGRATRHCSSPPSAPSAAVGAAAGTWARLEHLGGSCSGQIGTPGPLRGARTPFLPPPFAPPRLSVLPRLFPPPTPEDALLRAQRQRPPLPEMRAPEPLRPDPWSPRPLPVGRWLRRGPALEATSC